VASALPSISMVSNRDTTSITAGGLIPVQNGMEEDGGAVMRRVLERAGARVGIFVGGDTAFKLGTMPLWGGMAREMGRWCHVGRVNTQKRIKDCYMAGVTSFDGTSASMFADSLPRARTWALAAHAVFWPHAKGHLMFVTLCKRFTFDAAHRLPMLPTDHKCHRLHGHTYTVEVIVSGDVRMSDLMLIDYADIAAAWQRVHDKLDHRYLNDIPALEQPTTELLAYWIFDELHEPLHGEDHCLERIRVHESDSTWCEITREDYRSPHTKKFVEAMRSAKQAGACP